MPTLESKIKDKVKRALESLNAYRFMPVQSGLGAPGLDFYCCIRGLFVAVETKVPGAKLTARQHYTAKQIVDAGGIVFVIRDDIDIAHLNLFFKCALNKSNPTAHIHDKLFYITEAPSNRGPSKRRARNNVPDGANTT